MRVNLFGVGTKSSSPAITAQKRINCYVEMRKEQDRTSFSLVGRPALTSFISSLGSIPSRGLWAVNTLVTPLMFSVHGDTVYSIDNAANLTAVGSLLTNSGDVSMADDGKFMVIVDGTYGYVYNMQTPAGVNKITDGNFTTTPRTVTWQDNYFIVTSSGSTRQFQLSQITPSVDPTVWPAVQINFAGSGGGTLQNGVADHNILNLFGDIYTEFWQNTGSPDFPYAKIPGSSQQYGLAAPFSVVKFDNSLTGLFQDSNGARMVARLSGFGVKRISDSDIEYLLKSYPVVSDAQGQAFTVAGHPLYMLTLPTAEACFVFDALTQTWTQWATYGRNSFESIKTCYFVGNQYMTDADDGHIYLLDNNSYVDNDGPLVMEVWSKHIYNENKYIGITQLQVEVQAGVSNNSNPPPPVMELQVSKDGGNSFFSVGYNSLGYVGEYTQRLVWNTLGAARDWVLKLVISDPVKRVITGASCEMVGGPF
jgi:hypothetical protein